MRVGAIDIGSNSIRLLVADFPTGSEHGGLVTVARAGEACRLGRGLGDSGGVDPEIAERAGTLVDGFARRASALGSVHTIVGATAALRRATNGQNVADAIQERSGLPVRILSGQEEARLVYQAVVLGLGGVARRNPCVVFDLGGGSTEVVSGFGPEAGRWASLPVGAVNLTERFVRSDPISAAESEQIVEEVKSILMHDCALMPGVTPVLAGVGGTITVLASLDRELEVYDSDSIEGWVIPSSRLGGLIRRVAGSTGELRREWPVLGSGRSDIVAAGALAVGVLVERFQSRGIVCSTQGLRYGLARLAAAEAASPGGGERAGLPEATSG